MKYFACEGDFHMHENENKTCFELLESCSSVRKNVDKTYVIHY